MSTIQLIVDGVTVYQSGTAATPPAPSPSTPTPQPPAVQPPVAQPNLPVNARINAALPFERIWSDPSNSQALWPANVPFIIQVDVTDAMQGRYLATINFSDAGAVRADRQVCVSRVRGDFSGNQWVALQPSNSGQASVAVGQDTRPADIRMTAGTWYINVKNTSNAGHFLVEWANG